MSEALEIVSDKIDTDDEIESNVVELSTEELDKKFKKLRKKIGFDLAEELDLMPVDDLRRRIVRSQINMADTRAAMERDEDLARAKEQLGYVKQPYTHALTSQKAVAEYATLRLKEKT